MKIRERWRNWWNEPVTHHEAMLRIFGIWMLGQMLVILILLSVVLAAHWATT